MKKILSLFAMVGLVLSASAQNHQSKDILTVPVLVTGTNAFNITNLASVVTNVGMVHHTNVIYSTVTLSNNLTTMSGLTRVAGGVTNTASTKGLFNDIMLNPGRDGQQIFQTYPASDDATSNTNNYKFSGLNIQARLVNPFGSNGVVGIVFCPLWDGVTTPVNRADDWGFAFSYSLSQYNDISTNVPTWKWPGAKALRVRFVTNNFSVTQAAETYLTNSPRLVKLTANGWVP